MQLYTAASGHRLLGEAVLLKAGFDGVVLVELPEDTSKGKEDTSDTEESTEPLGG